MHVVVAKSDPGQRIILLAPSAPFQSRGRHSKAGRAHQRRTQPSRTGLAGVGGISYETLTRLDLATDYIPWTFLGRSTPTGGA
jgi:hypothetical protein